MKKGLIVFAREPLPGTVKTRLAASIGNHAAAELYESMLRDVLKSARQLRDVDTVVYWDCEEESLPVLAERYECNARRQSQGSLGQRMQTALEEMFATSCDVCCIVGSDAPDLPISFIQDAYELLAESQWDLVFGPSRDGGYYLLGQREVWPQLFTNIPWSSADVLEKSLAAARVSGLTAALLPEWQDIDTLEDLRAFQKRNQLTEYLDII
jgi:rSAM/selenodomain-associated transferase 1